MTDIKQPLGLFIQPACLQHKYIRHANSSHIFERPERLRAVLLGVAAAVARLEEAQAAIRDITSAITPSSSQDIGSAGLGPGSRSTGDELSSLLSGLSIQSSFKHPRHLAIVPPPLPSPPGQVLLHHPALQYSHSPPSSDLFDGMSAPTSSYLKDLHKWANEAVEMIKTTGCEIPTGLGLNQGDLYLGPGSILAIEGAVQTVCQAVDRICDFRQPPTNGSSIPVTPPGRAAQATFIPKHEPDFVPHDDLPSISKAFCAIRPPGHHCGEDAPSGFCYVNNVVVGALHAYMQHNIDRAIIIDFDLHHGNGTQALVMPINAASYAEDLALKAGKPPSGPVGRNGKRRQPWKGFYGSVHDIYSYPCEDGDLDLISDASISLAAHGQYIENIHLQPYSSEADFYERIYPKYLTLLEKAKVFMEETGADSDRTVVFISAGFDACEHEYQAMQRHDRRVPTSFYSRYTRDIVAFANRHTGGKIVSVLEGGYSDRALTSAAMGHVLGLMNERGQDTWWSDSELNNIEKATKKKRTGKIAPFPSELSSHPHLIRTHALLSHFEGVGQPAEAPSVGGTPQRQGHEATLSGPGSRMTLRDRRKAQDTNTHDEVTPPSTAARRVRSAAATPKKAIPAASTPVRKVHEASALKHDLGVGAVTVLDGKEKDSPTKASITHPESDTPVISIGSQKQPNAPPLLQVEPPNPDRTSGVFPPTADSMHGSKAHASEAITAREPNVDQPSFPASLPLQNHVTSSQSLDASQPDQEKQQAPPKIYLRFSRPVSPIPPLPVGVDAMPGSRPTKQDLSVPGPGSGSGSGLSSRPVPSSGTQSLYPTLPALGTGNHLEYRSDRETSAGTETSGDALSTTTTTSAGYVSAASIIESDSVDEADWGRETGETKRDGINRSEEDSQFKSHLPGAFTNY